MRTKKGLELDIVSLVRRLREGANGALLYYRVVPHSVTANLFCIQYAEIFEAADSKEIWKHLITMDSQFDAEKTVSGLRQKFSKRATYKPCEIAASRPKESE